MRQRPRLLVFFLGLLAGVLLVSMTPFALGGERSREAALQKGDEFVFNKNIYRVNKVTSHANGTYTYRMELK